MDGIEILTADITTLDVDAIVNAANTSLLGGGGVDGAIHRAGGPSILAACRRIVARQGGCPTGQAVITTGGDLPADWVIHTAGPIHDRDPQAAPELLGSCYRRSLDIATRRGFQSIAFPSISTGVYGYPIEEASRVAMGVLMSHDTSGNLPVRVIMCCFSEADRKVYADTYDQLRVRH
ncbi:O-acetyl-ADP-ribose deacetylase [soil metagenome]